MKLAVSALAALAATIALALPAGAAVPGGGPRNASFESGFAAWTVTVPAGAFAEIVPGVVRQGGGTKYARLWTDGPGGGASIDQTYPAFAGSQTIGFARFNSGEGGPGSCFFNDTALITIDGNTVFEASSCLTGSTGAVVWTYTHTFTGDHTIHGEVQNGFDDLFDSTLDMDAPLVVRITP
jgi:hypothetical protein